MRSPRSAIRATPIQDLCLASAPSLQFAVLLAGDPSDHQSVRSQLQESEPQLPDRDPQFAAECRASGNAWLRLPAQLWLGHAAVSPGGRWSVPAPGELSAGQQTVNIPGHGASRPGRVEPKLRQSTFLSYDNEDWTVSLQNQWLGSVKTGHQRQCPQRQQPELRNSRICRRYNVLDVTVSKRFQAMGRQTARSS